MNERDDEFNRDLAEAMGVDYDMEKELEEQTTRAETAEAELKKAADELEGFIDNLLWISGKHLEDRKMIARIEKNLQRIIKQMRDAK